VQYSELETKKLELLNMHLNTLLRYITWMKNDNKYHQKKSYQKLLLLNKIKSLFILLKVLKIYCLICKNIFNF
jgi:hypothetical protein